MRVGFRKGACLDTNYPIGSPTRCKHFCPEMYCHLYPRATEFCKSLCESAHAAILWVDLVSPKIWHPFDSPVHAAPSDPAPIHCSPNPRRKIMKNIFVGN